MDVEVSTFDVAKLPTIAKDDASVKRKLDNAKRQPVRIFHLIFPVA
jgi:nucleolar protein 15